MKRFLKSCLALALFAPLLFSCSDDLKPYERVYVDDPEMEANSSICISFQRYVHSIREGSVTAVGKKGTGGCGCN